MLDKFYNWEARRRRRSTEEFWLLAQCFFVFSVAKKRNLALI